ncbi:LacI family DNA-binding transcriptional regulator [Pengzhenrongella sp.]|jgi:DNA-binding LacI/PurR family transcriptional regulator|uniref:LacI family DNA-binding transcriptional regulator n=1 Tax=Pengzhenrongella sp. TaxID=2888820 RepID=UPI002F939A86
MTEGLGAVGLVLARPARLLAVEPFFMEFITGIEETLAERDLSILLHVVPEQDAEVETYRRWADRRLVDAVIVVNLTVDDPRPAVLRELGLPSLLVGVSGPSDVPAVRTDNEGAARAALTHLLELGHRRIARVSGPAQLLHTRLRTAALLEGGAAVGLEPVTLEGDYSDDAGVELTRWLLARPAPPTVIIYDNDVMAVAGLRTALGLGVAVPDELSLLAWDDSVLCRLTSPALTTISVDVHEFGVRVARSILELLDGAPVAERWSPSALLMPRGTTAAAPGS